jgi:hypothetical protein
MPLPAIYTSKLETYGAQKYTNQRHKNGISSSSSAAAALQLIKGLSLLQTFPPFYFWRLLPSCITIALYCVGC